MMVAGLMVGPAAVRAAEATGSAASAGSKGAPQTIQLFGASIKYYEAGRGPTLVLVHGLGSSAQGDWGKVMADLAKTHHVLALD
ncbi:alpha/beta fold hydrolase [Nitrospirillum iridis]|uniref:Alpha/beta hydrolase n=1 Tax=Nitrospirillum iridis TaxID=765888 RepID=A0A7X0AWR5_9PROT|nr:hypothetical protein [Nitrospirillum iridis]MBB6250089.1 hypothetical protein [Nitrospirillum iridis]